MGSRQRAWAKATRARWKVELGGKCEDCGCTDLGLLEFHHRVPRRWRSCHVESSMRIALLRKEIAAGEIGLLCAPCNKARGEPPPPEVGDPDVEPF